MPREGFIKCHGLGCDNQEAAVTETANGTFSVTCHRCRLSSYAKKGTKAHAAILAVIDPTPEPTPAPAAKPEPAPVPKPKEPKPRAGFDLSKL